MELGMIVLGGGFGDVEVQASLGNDSETETTRRLPWDSRHLDDWPTVTSFQPSQCGVIMPDLECLPPFMGSCTFGLPSGPSGSTYSCVAHGSHRSKDTKHI